MDEQRLLLREATSPWCIRPREPSMESRLVEASLPDLDHSVGTDQPSSMTPGKNGRCRLS